MKDISVEKPGHKLQLRYAGVYDRVAIALVGDLQSIYVFDRIVIDDNETRDRIVIERFKPWPRWKGSIPHDRAPNASTAA